MHAYRDAIRRSAGAYVLFPGTSGPRQFREYVELIPGLGAFPLRPGSDAGVSALRRFIGDVLLHAADQATAEERSRFWASRVFHGSSGSETGRTVDFLDRPPADTAVLLDHVFDERLWRWTEETLQYVVSLSGDAGSITFRAEELAAPLILLFGLGQAVIFERHGAWTLVDKDDLLLLNHPVPSDRPALLCQLVPVPEQPPWLTELPLMDALAKSGRPGAPVLVEWLRLLEPRIERPAPPPAGYPRRPSARQVPPKERRSPAAAESGAMPEANEPPSARNPTSGASRK